jgi:alpha-tubulin suppressor-like RCC1 family protein
MARTLCIPALALLLGLASVACAKEDPLFCTAEEMCLEGYQYCDISGSCPASGFHGNTCIPEPCWDAGPGDLDAGADAGLEPDAMQLQPAALDVGPGGRSFGSVVLGNQSGTATFVVTNVGETTSGTLVASLNGAAPADFTIESDLCSGQTLNAAASCDIDVLFAPTSDGVRFATLDVTATPGGTTSSDLDGIGLTAGDLSMSPTTHDFNTLSVGAMSGTVVLTVTNNGGSPTGTLATTLDDTVNFTIVNDNCDGIALNAAGDCTVSVRTNPTSVGAQIGSLTVGATPGGNAATSLTSTGSVQVSVSLAGTEDGSVTSSPGGIDCGSDCSETYTFVTSVTLTPLADPHAQFTGWSGASCSGLDPCTVTTDAHHSVTAPFAINTIATSEQHTCAIVPANGAVRCWGDNEYGQLGLGHTTDVGDSSPASAGGTAIASAVVQVVAGTYHSCALSSDGSVRCWGRNQFGQLGYGHTDNIGDGELVGGAVMIGVPAIQLAAGGAHTCALLNTGNVRCWGEAQFGQLGYGNTNDLGDTMNTLPFSNGDVPIGESIVQISAAGSNTCALAATGSAYCWGYGNDGQLGNGATSNIGTLPSTTPEQVGPLDVGEAVVQIAAGFSNTCILLSAGRVRCWGANLFGQLGLGDGSQSAVGGSPGEVPSAFDDISTGGEVARLAVGASKVCVLMKNQAVRCWGWDQSGSDGIPGVGGIGSSDVPSAFDAINLGGAAVEVDANAHVCARMATGAIRCWGSGVHGKLGYGNEDNIGDNEHPAAAGDVPYIP